MMIAQGNSYLDTAIVQLAAETVYKAIHLNF